MKIALLLVLLLMTLTSCRSRTAQDYFNRPNVIKCLTLEKEGYYACDGEVLKMPSGLIVPKSNDDYFLIEEYFEEREFGHYICLEFPNRCN